MSKHVSKPAVAEIETISPEEALDLITEHVALNRPRSNNTVAKYAEAMRLLQWKLNGHTIVIDEKGNVIDGQHRLAACVESEIPLTTFVVRGVPTDVFDSLDQGKVRTAPQYLAIRGESSSNQLATLLRMIWSWERGWVTRSGRPGKDMTIAGMFELLDRHPNARKSVEQAASHHGDTPFGGAAGTSVFSFMHYATWETGGSRAKSDAFLEGLMTGKDLHEDDPRLVARNRLLRERGKEGRRQSPRGVFNRMIIVAMLIRSWNAYVGNKSLTELRLSVPDEMPELRGEEAYWKRMGRPYLMAPNGRATPGDQAII